MISGLASPLCPCDGKRHYRDCCGRLHAGEPAADAEALMRSRYSAFVLADEAYLLATWHATTRPAAVDFSDTQKTRWLGLVVKQHVVLSTTRAQVEFVARYKIGGGSAVRLRELSEFVREDGRWYYLRGELD